MKHCQHDISASEVNTILALNNNKMNIPNKTKPNKTFKTVMCHFVPTISHHANSFIITSQSSPHNAGLQQ